MSNIYFTISKRIDAKKWVIQHDKWFHLGFRPKHFAKDFAKGRQSATFQTKARRTGWKSGEEIQTPQNFVIVIITMRNIFIIVIITMRIIVTIVIVPIIIVIIIIGWKSGTGEEIQTPHNFIIIALKLCKHLQTLDRVSVYFTPSKKSTSS